ncbi:MAG TPA: SDR family oxidoreductase, partial [Longimicrobiaceae bacterium]|nr:SDR family oxidoreductase [Longimicrobiaceae bacterium]
MRSVLIAGASGRLGAQVTCEFKQQGYRVRALTRTPDRLAHLREHIDEVERADLTDPAQLEGVCRAGELVFSCAGASMALADFRDRHSFTEIDYRGNLNLLQAAQRAGVWKFGYVSLFGARELLHTEYAAAHERFVDALRASGLPYTVIRPTGYFSFFAEILKLARQGQGMVIGSGEARTNPIHEADLAKVCVRAIEAEEDEIPVGGPEAFTRREIVELAFAALGRSPQVRSLPPWLFRGIATLSKPLNPRLAALLDFRAAVSQV